MSWGEAASLLSAVGALLSLPISVVALRRSGPRVRVRGVRAALAGDDDDPDYLRSLGVVVWNRGDAPVTVEHWGFDYATRLRFPVLSRRGVPTSIGMYSVGRRKGDVPVRLEPGGPSETFFTPLVDVRRFVMPPRRLRAYVIVGHSPRRVRAWGTLPVTDFAVVEAVRERPKLRERLGLSRRPPE